MSEVRDLALNCRALTTASKQLAVAIEVDSDILANELRPYLEDLAALQLAAKKLVIDDEDSNQRALNMMNLAWDKQKGLEQIWARYKTPLNAARKVVLDLEKQSAGAAEDLKKLLQSKSAKFIRDCTIAKQAAEGKLARMASTERSRLLQEAEEAMLDGDVSMAQAKLAESQMIVAPTLPDAMPVVTGARITPKFRAKCDDTIALLKAIVEKKVPLMHEVRGEMRPLVVVDQVVLNALVSRLGPGLRAPGITVEEDVQVAAGGRAS